MNEHLKGVAMSQDTDSTSEDTLADEPRPGPAQLDRRSFLVLAAGASLGASGVFVGATAIQALLPPARSIDGMTQVGALRVARLSDLEVDKPVLVRYGDDNLFVVKISHADARVFDAACPHARCTLHFNDTSHRFECPCHASSFTIEGKRLSGPAPRDMLRVVSELTNGEVIVSGLGT